MRIRISRVFAVLAAAVMLGTITLAEVKPVNAGPGQLGNYDSADLGTQSPYPTINAGDSIHIYITPHNNSSMTWSAQNGYGYAGKDGWSYYGQKPLWRDVPPGGTITFEDTVTPPATPGTYNYGFLLTHNGNTFGPYFFIPVTVVGSTPPSPSVSVPATPYNVNLVAQGPSTLYVTWTPASYDETSFDITRDQHFAPEGHVPGGTYSYVWQGLPVGSYICIGVRAVNSAGASPYTGWTCTTLPRS